jgi:hypothetical protein
LSREARFMQEWQQTIIDRGEGNDDQIYNNLVDASVKAHSDINPVDREYGIIRTIRAIVMGAAVFEILNQEALTGDTRPAVLDENHFIPGELLEATKRLPLPLQDAIYDYMSVFRLRSAANDTSLSPRTGDPAFDFYNTVNAKFVDPYWDARIASERSEPCTQDRLETERELSKNLDYALHSLVLENVSATLDVCMAMAVGLCFSKRRICSKDELSEFLIKNAETALVLTTAKRGTGGTLPFRYASKVFAGDAEVLGYPYVVVEKNRLPNQAHWSHPTINRGARKNPGHCPASSYNRLRPHTQAKGEAVAMIMAGVGLGHLIVNDTITASQLMLGRTFNGISTTAYSDESWQVRLLAAWDK